MHTPRRLIAVSSALIVLLAALGQVAAAQIPGLSKPSATAAQEPVDPLERTTPRGSIIAFSRAVERQDFGLAARYLQLTAEQRGNAVLLAVELKGLIDRELHETLSTISDTSTGSLEDGLEEDRERIGPLNIDGQKSYIMLVRVRDPEDGPIWLISSETLRHIPAIADAAGRTWIETHLPVSLQERELLGLSLAHWIVLITLLAGSFTLLSLIGGVVNFVAKRVIKPLAHRQDWDDWYQGTRWPAISVLTIVIQFLAIPPLGFPLTFRVIYARIALVAFVIVLAWLLRRVLALGFTHARGLMRGKDHASTASLMLLAQRMIQAVIVVVAIVIILILLGVESKTALAVLGVVGVALALGAQKTVENLLGGIFLLTDKALAVGDYCTIGNQSGVIEDVTLRSVRLRTSNQSLVSLPAGPLAQTGIENFASRRKMAMQTTLRLTYATSADQLKLILGGAQALLQAHPKVEKDSAYLRLVNFGAEAIELELFAYFQTANPDEFRVLRENFLLEVATLVESAGSALTPMKFIQVEGPATPRSAS